MHDIHPDFLVAFERIRQAHLQHQTTIQRLVRHAPMAPPPPRGRWAPAIGEGLRSLGRTLRVLGFPAGMEKYLTRRNVKECN
jgi:hypothetical protein